MEQTTAVEEFGPALRARAREILKDKWGTTAVVSLVYLVVSIIASAILENVGSLIVSGPLSFGIALYFLKLIRNEPVELPVIFDGFKPFKQFIRTFTAYLVSMIFVLLWAVLLIVPGVMAALSYSQIYYLLVDDPDLQPMDALKRSKAMMEGHKMEFFMLGLSFMGWLLLTVLTCGIGFIWLIPYMSTTFALYYRGLVEQMEIPIVEIPVTGDGTGVEEA